MITYQKAYLTKLYCIHFYKQCFSMLHTLDLGFSAILRLFTRILENLRSEVYNLDSFDKYFRRIVD